MPTDHEQYLLELINRARADPAAEAARYGIDLNEGLPAGTITPDAKQPLAFDACLIEAARGHSQWMIDTDTFSHVGAGGSMPWDRAEDAGYDWDGMGENIAAKYTTAPSFDITAWVADLHEALFVDDDYPERGHRKNLCAGEFEDIGNGVVTGVYTIDQTDYNALMITEDFGYDGGGAVLTGVVYDDELVADDGFYTPGEGLGEVSLTAVRAADGSKFAATTFSSGGYNLPLPPGTYTVTAAGGQLAGSITASGVAVGSENVKVDFEGTADTTPPTVTAVTINACAIQRTRIVELALLFDDDVDVGAGSLALHNDTTGEEVAVCPEVLTVAGDSAAWDLAGLTLPDGRYTATLAAMGVADDAGWAMAADYAFTFHQLGGDANGDAEVGAADLSLLADHFDGTVNPWCDGDFTGDGAVSSADLSLLADGWDTALA
jgi:hypothetical protein